MVKLTARDCYRWMSDDASMCCRPVDDPGRDAVGEDRPDREDLSAFHTTSSRVRRQRRTSCCVVGCRLPLLPSGCPESARNISDKKYHENNC